LLDRGRGRAGGEGHTLLGRPGQRRRLIAAAQRRLGIDGERVAHDHAQALDRPGEPDLTLLDFVQTFEDFVPEVGRGQGRGANEIGVRSRSFRLATLHRHARILHFRPIGRSLVALLIAGACTRSMTGTGCEA
jgi:hypothetical protein